MTIRETPPSSGYSRTATGPRNPLYPGYRMTKAEERAVERRNRYRHTDAPDAPVTNDRPQKTCFSCGRTYHDAIGQNSGKCPSCRARAASVAVTRTCPHCGETFIQHTSGPKQKWCSTRCRNNANRVQRQQSVPAEKRTCIACGETFLARPSREGRLSRTCSIPCRTRAGHAERKRRKQLGVEA